MTDPSNLGIPIYQFHSEPPESTMLVYNYMTTPDEYPGWHLDGIAFYAFPSPQSGVVPVYQFYNDSSGYVKNMLSLSSGQGEGWKNIGVPFYAYPNNKSQCGLAVYQFSTTDLRFYYTTNDSGIFGPGWTFNGGSILCCLVCSKCGSDLDESDPRVEKDYREKAAGIGSGGLLSLVGVHDPLLFADLKYSHISRQG